MMADDTALDLSSLTADIVSAYVSHNRVEPSALPGVIADVHKALGSAGQPAAAEPETTKPSAAEIRKSRHPDALTSFIDGRKYQSLKRHLTTQGLTPEEYRTRFGLPKDYPMVAEGYSARRSELAKSLGLGRKAPAASEPAGDSTPAPKKGRTKKAKPDEPLAT